MNLINYSRPLQEVPRFRSRIKKIRVNVPETNHRRSLFQYFEIEAITLSIKFKQCAYAETA